MKSHSRQHSILFVYLFLAVFVTYPITKVMAQSSGEIIIKGKVTDETNNLESRVSACMSKARRRAQLLI